MYEFIVEYKTDSGYIMSARKLSNKRFNNAFRNFLSDCIKQQILKGKVVIKKHKNVSYPIKLKHKGLKCNVKELGLAIRKKKKFWHEGKYYDRSNPKYKRCLDEGRM